MAKKENRQPRTKQRLSRKTKKLLVNSIGREQYHAHMSELGHDTSKKAQAEIFARSAQQPYAIRSGRLQRLLAYSNPISMK
jgi:hypothetical protein